MTHDKEYWRDLFDRRHEVLCERLFMSKSAPSETFDDYEITCEGQRKAVDACRLFSTRFLDRYGTYRGRIGLLLSGGYGTGKTMLSRAIMHELARQRCPGFAIKAMDLFDILNDRNKLDVPLFKLVQLLCGVSVLCIDEIGVQSWSDAERKRLQQILDGRADAGLPTVICTNLRGAELTACVGERVMSRMTATLFPVAFTWQDHRRIKSPMLSTAEEVF